MTCLGGGQTKGQTQGLDSRARGFSATPPPWRVVLKLFLGNSLENAVSFPPNPALLNLICWGWAP